VHVQLLHDVITVGLHGFDAEEEARSGARCK
jgi:hypothetical protein